MTGDGLAALRAQLNVGDHADRGSADHAERGRLPRGRQGDQALRSVLFALSIHSHLLPSLPQDSAED